MEKTVYRQPRRGPGRALAGLRRRLRAAPALDLPFLAILLALVCLGLVVLFSAGYAVALYPPGATPTPTSAPSCCLRALGVAAMYAASFVDYHVWHRLAWPLMGLSLLLLAVVLFMPEYNGCKRWIVLPGLGTLQPSEIAKFSVVLVFSHIISLNHDRMKTFTTGVLPFAVILAAVTVLMLLEPHLSGTLLILGIGAVLMFVGGTGLKWFGLAGAGGCGGHCGGGHFAAGAGALRRRPPWPAGRTPLPTPWRGPPDHPKPVRHRVGRHCRAGAGQQSAEIPLRPEPQNDFIFSICARNWALWGRRWSSGCFCCCFCGACPLRCGQRTGSAALLVVGFVVQVILQAVLNIAVVTNTIPNTGISLPFFSSGGTSLMMLLGEMGIVLSVSRQADAA